MALFAISVLAFLLLMTIPCLAQEQESVGLGAVAGTKSSERVPGQLVVTEKDRYIRQAYTDVFAILSEDNTCSCFYGGPRAATAVLNNLIKGITRRELPQEISLRMTGNTQQLRDPDTGVIYRLFENEIVNSRGSFYQHPIDHWQRLPHDIGSFAAGSRPARALILLHELGHMIKASNGAWLIADDADDGWQSRENTRRVQNACFQRLKVLR